MHGPPGRHGEPSDIENQPEQAPVSAEQVRHDAAAWYGFKVRVADACYDIGVRPIFFWGIIVIMLA